MRRRALLALPVLGGCADLSYKARAVNGHLELLSRAEPIEQLLLRPATPEPTRRLLELALRLRRFASQELGLPDNNSYSRYVELAEGSVVWNLVAAPRHGLSPKRWCFPLMGCVAYRGHYERARAEAEAAELRAQGWDVYLYGVPAYSSLGWSRLLGGDPLLSSFLRWGEAELARLLFHELAHQKVYAADDSGFNESYASAVEELGLEAWWAAHPDPAAQARDAALQQRRARWRALALQTRERLQTLYADASAPHEAGKTAAFAALREALKQLTQHDAGYAPYLAWAQGANNAHLVLLSTYQLQVPAFKTLFHERCGGDWQRFHNEAARMAALPASQRSQGF